jgi:uncharacterized protein (TIGR02246 family)
MKRILPLLLLIAGCAGADKPATNDEAKAMEPVAQFYAAFANNFSDDATFATEDWNHINPLGGRTRNRDDTLKEVRAVHASFLKDVTDTIESADVRFASDDVAVITVSRTSPYALPGAAEAISHRQIRTFVVVRRKGEWKVMQDHNTEVVAPPA